MFNPFKKFKDVTYKTLSYLDSIAEIPLRLIPGYRAKQDDILESYLNQCLEGKDPGKFEDFKVDFQATPTKSTYMGTDIASGYLSLATLNPIYYLAGNVISGVSHYIRSGKLRNIVNSMPDFEIDQIKSMLDLGDVKGVRGMLQEQYHY